MRFTGCFVLDASCIVTGRIRAAAVSRAVRLTKCQAIIADRTIYCSGVIGIELDEPKVVPGGVGAQAATALKYLSDLLEDAGSGIDKVVKTTILLTDMQDYDAVNVEYKKVFSSNFPARTCVAVSKLPLGAAVEIEAIALVGDVEHVTE